MSQNYQPAPEGKDPELWRIAQKRAKFKSHLLSYIIVNGFLWAIWFFTQGRHQWMNTGELLRHSFPWPIWPMLGWGIGLAFHYAEAYLSLGSNAVETEYEKLKKQKNKN